MIPASPVLMRDLVLIGGGHAHALLLRMWGMRPLEGVRLTVIDPSPVAAYSGMLPGYVAGHYRREELEIDLVRLCRFAGARLVIGAATAIDPVARQVHVGGRGAISYDVASVDIGIHTEMPELPGFADHGIAAKPLGRFAEAWQTYLGRLRRGRAEATAAVIGGGVAGIELVLAMAHAMRLAAPDARLTLIEAQDDIVPGNPAVRARVAAELAQAGIDLRVGTEVARVEADAVSLADGGRIDSAFTLGVAGARAHGWLSDCDLPVTDDGYLRVGADLRVAGQQALFAAGDCAHLSHAPRPKAGVYAVRAAPVLFHNLRAALTGGDMQAFRPQKHYLKLVSLGGKSALAEKGGWQLAGPLLWRWKDRIDRKFMSKLAQLPQMPVPAAPRDVVAGAVKSDEPLCGGCGSKVAPDALAQVLAVQPRLERDDVLSGPGDDAAVIRVGGAEQVLTTDHLRAFTEDIGAMARIAALHALGDIWAMGARPQAALVSVVLPRMSTELQERSLGEIMQAAGAALRAAGAEVVGGHSSMGAETTIGFSLTGLLQGAAIGHAGARAGDALILTRAIGSGTILAGEMRRLASGRDVAALLRVLQQPQGDAAALLQEAHAMTDVTGFGLAGHLAAICRASGLGAEIALEAVPVFSGAEALAAAGVRSTIWQDNRAAAPVQEADGPKATLLHDPQTAGGLLAAVAPDRAGALVAALRAAGHTEAAVIGRMTDGPAGLTAV